MNASIFKQTVRSYVELILTKKSHTSLLQWFNNGFECMGRTAMTSSTLYKNQTRCFSLTSSVPSHSAQLVITFYVVWCVKLHLWLLAAHSIIPIMSQMLSVSWWSIKSPFWGLFWRHIHHGALKIDCEPKLWYLMYAGQLCFDLFHNSAVLWKRFCP